MNDNMTLLSQEEIDALVKFMMEQAGATNNMGQVLSQNEIDKLVKVMKSIQVSDTDNDMVQESDVTRQPMIVLEGRINEGVDAAKLRLCFEIDEKTDEISIFCMDETDGKHYELKPGMFSAARNVVDDVSAWGRFISPMDFDRIAFAIRVKYTDETFRKVCARYAKCLYGDEERVLPDYYLPSTRNLLLHVVK